MKGGDDNETRDRAKQNIQRARRVVEELRDSGLRPPDAVMVLVEAMLLITRMQNPHLTLEQACELTVTAAANYFKIVNQGESS